MNIVIEIFPASDGRSAASHRGGDTIVRRPAGGYQVRVTGQGRRMVTALADSAAKILAAELTVAGTDYKGDRK